jgi:hypothetical protein
MKKFYLLIALFLMWQVNSQVINQNAGWPNPAWTVTGTYSTNPLAFEANPTTTANFAFDDDDAGSTSLDNIAAESPIIDLSAAVSGGESKVRVNVMYVYRALGGYLRLEYWNADTSTWIAWGANIPGNSTVTDNFCSGTKTMYSSSDLDISTFTSTQLSGFRYRISFDDLDWEWGFCFDSPTIISVPQPCLSNTDNYPPGGPITSGVCDGITSTIVSTSSWAGDYFDVNVISGETYKFNSSVSTDFFTLSTDANATAAASGVTPLTWVSTITGLVRVNLNTSITCGTQNTNRTTSIVCGVTCLNGTLYPAATYTPTTCDGSTVNTVATDSYAGEYSNINVFSTNTYTFASSIATDYITIASEDGTTALAAGTGSVTYAPTVSGILRMYIHTNTACGNQATNRVRTVVCSSSEVVPGCASNPSPADGATGILINTDFTLSWDAPTTGGAVLGYNIYAGDSPTTLNFIDTTTTNSYGPVQVNTYDTLIYWIAVPYNGAGEGTGCIGTPWSFTTESAPPPPANDLCGGAIALTPGGDFNANPVTVFNGGATDSGVPDPACSFYLGGDLWYSVVVPASGSITIETQDLDGSISDTGLAVYTGTCAGLTEFNCNDDGGIGLFSLLSFTSLTPGQVLYIRVFEYGNDQIGSFLLSAYDGSLTTTNFDNSNFTFYPNPVKDVLNLQYSNEISKVQVVNLLGQEVIAKAINASQTQIDMSALTSGTYLVKVTANGIEKTIKVLKQ